jgi:hypothetical protein
VWNSGANSGDAPASLPHDFEFAKWKKLPAIHLDGASLAAHARFDKCVSKIAAAS